MAHKTITRHKKILTRLKTELIAAQEQQATAFNRHAITQLYKVGKWVFLNQKNIKTTRPCCKLNWKFIGPFQILEKYRKNAYRLDLPAQFEFHNVFHVLLHEKTLQKDKKKTQQGILLLWSREISKRMSTMWSRILSTVKFLQKMNSIRTPPPAYII